MSRTTGGSVWSAVGLICLLLVMPQARSQAPKPAESKPEVWAVIIGIDAYQDASIPPCPAARRDARELARWLTETARWPADHVLLMTRDGLARHPANPRDRINDLQPTRENLDWAIEEWLGARVREGDLALVSFGGQATARSGRAWLVPIDARLSSLEQTAWSPEKAIDGLVLSHPCALMCWLDTSLHGRGQAFPGDPPAPEASERWLDRLSRWPGTSAWIAATGVPSAETKEGSLFAVAVRKALGTRPDSLLALLRDLHAEEALSRQGFRSRGGVGPRLALWPAMLLPEADLTPRLLKQRGHAERVSALAISSDTTRLYSAGEDSTVRLWRNGEANPLLLDVLSGHNIGVTAMDLSPSGRLLASGDGDGRVLVRDLARGQNRLARGPSPHRARIEQLAFIPGSDRFVTLDQQGQCALWDAGDMALKVEPLVDLEGRRIATAAGPVAVVIASGDGRLHRFGPDGQRLEPIEGTPAAPTALAVASDGDAVAVGDRDGHVVVRPLVGDGPALYEHDHEAPVTTLRFSSDGLWLVIGAGRSLLLADRTAESEARPVEWVSDTTAEVAFSPDNRWLAILTDAGDLTVRGLLSAVRPDLRKRSEPESLLVDDVSCMRFSDDGLRLVTGMGDGGIRAWYVPSWRERPEIAAMRGMVAQLAVAPDGLGLLQISTDGVAQIWELKDGRGVETLPGFWASGVFLPDGKRLAMVRDRDDGGNVVLLERAGGRVLDVTFEPPPARDGSGPSQIDFGRVAVSPDGQHIAAASASGRDEIVCLWSVSGGPAQVVARHDRTLTALSFTADGSSLLTAAEDGAAKLWRLDAKEANPSPITVLDDPRGRAITAACVAPAGPPRIATASWSVDHPGEILLWTWPKGGSPQDAKPSAVGTLGGRVETVCFTRDGRHLTAVGDDRQVRIWELVEGQPPRPLILPIEQQHAEMVPALAAWPDRSLVASGSRDGTVRLWAPEPNAPDHWRLVGTLSTAPGPDFDPESEPDDPSLAAAEWVAYTPEGVFDGSHRGDQLVTFVVGGEVHPLEAYAPALFHFGLTDALRQGVTPPPVPHTEPPALVLDPPAEPVTKNASAELALALAPGLSPDDLRLYQNGVPVRSGVKDFDAVGDPGTFRVRVALSTGENHFYALAGRPGDVDARSGDVLIQREGEKLEGRLHVLALGISDYKRFALKYADDDAKAIGPFLYGQGAGGEPAGALQIVLTDADVTPLRLETEFSNLRRAVEGHPEDTVVLFLAGHTDVIRNARGRDQFSLLLAGFPFPADAPAQANARGGAVLGQVQEAQVSPRFYVTYATLQRELSHLDALHRLIILDACESEAIFDDDGVRLVEKLMETGSRPARTAYLLAARRGEAAGESSALLHGLLTYTILHGLNAPGLVAPPGDLEAFRDPSRADLDGDGVVNTLELRLFVSRALPALADRSNTLITRGRPEPAHPAGAVAADAGVGQELRLQSADASFPLVVLPPSPDGP